MRNSHFACNFFSGHVHIDIVVIKNIRNFYPITLLVSIKKFTSLKMGYRENVLRCFSITVFILAVVLIDSISSFSVSVPPVRSVCKSMQPGHDKYKPQTAPSPFIVRTDVTEIKGGNAVEGNLNFKVFLITILCILCFVQFTILEIDFKLFLGSLLTRNR